MCPEGVIPVAWVLIAPGKSNEVSLDWALAEAHVRASRPAAILEKHAIVLIVSPYSELRRSALMHEPIGQAARTVSAYCHQLVNH
jgi:hypothetical protein